MVALLVTPIPACILAVAGHPVHIWSEYLKSCGIPCQIAWYIMTSPSTVKPTVDFFKKNSYFGLSAEDVVVFQQGTLPCRTFQGKIIMASKHEISRQDVTLDCTMNLLRFLSNDS